MEANYVYLVIGLTAGLVIGILITLLFVRIRGDASGLFDQRLALEGDRVRLETELSSARSLAEENKRIASAKEVELASLRMELSSTREEKRGLEVKVEEERKNTDEKLALLEKARTTLSDAFAALSKQALDQNNQSFVVQAEQVFKRFQQSAQTDLQARQDKISEIVAPVQKSLEEVDKQIKTIELGRVAAFSALGEQLSQMQLANLELKGKTSDLVRVLQNSKSRGRWGELQLKRIVELAGMTAHCDFHEQFNVAGEDGRLIPDMIVSLPAKRIIVIDAKAPMESYYAAHESTEDASRKHHMTQHAKSLRRHVGQLSQKSYSENFDQSPEFVLLFLPSEAVFSAALEHDAELIEFGAEKNVIIATPTTLIALLKAAAYGWRQEAIADEAQKLGNLGKQLYSRLGKMAEFIDKLGKSLDKSVKTYNSMVGSIEGSVLPSARRFRDLNVVGAEKTEIAMLEPVETISRELQAAEFRIAGDGVGDAADNEAELSGGMIGEDNYDDPENSELVAASE